MSSTRTSVSQINAPVSSDVSSDSRTRTNNVEPDLAGNGMYTMNNQSNRAKKYYNVCLNVLTLYF